VIYPDLLVEAGKRAPAAWAALLDAVARALRKNYDVDDIEGAMLAGVTSVTSTNDRPQAGLLLSRAAQFVQRVDIEVSKREERESRGASRSSGFKSYDSGAMAGSGFTPAKPADWDQ
jgi:hypothetical protein